MQTKALLPLALVCALLVAPSANAAGSELKDAISDYNAHRYGQALEKLSKLEKSMPNDTNVHYYKALSYQGAAQMSAAREQYFWVYRNGGDSRLKYNSWVALQQMDRWSQTRAYAGNGNNFHKVRAVNYHSSGRTQPVIETST